MMPFAIIAEFPLGTYRAAFGEGQQDRWPSPARLHAALVAAAGQGVRAVERDGSLGPSQDDTEALSWIEANPPDGLALPLSKVNGATNGAYRDIGLLAPKMRGTKRPLKRDNFNVALAESIMWLWEEDPPQKVRDALDDLCPDVPYLGRANSPVRLRTATHGHEMTHRRDAHPRLSTRQPTDIELSAARPGRTAALTEAHHTALTAPPPNARSDRASTDESELSPVAVKAALAQERYAAVTAERGERSPWEVIWTLPIVGRKDLVAGVDRVRWCVALHRALISLHGDGAPALLTGHYAEGVEQPANRIAVHLVNNHPAMSSGIGTDQSFVVAVPRGADRLDVATVANAVTALRVVRSHGEELRIAAPDERPAPSDASDYWAPNAGGARCWVTTPAVPELRPPRDGGRWSMDDTVAFSTAMVFRDRLLDDETRALARDPRHRRLAELAREHGLEVLDVKRLAPSDVSRYAHKVPHGLVVQPYTAILRLGALANERSWVALGQSRHLGGGLLTPIDMDEAVLEAWRRR